MTFLAPHDILVLEKNNGTVRRIVNGQLLDKPLLDVNVANKVERGMVGIASTKAKNGTINVFLYYTESKKDGDDICPKANYCISGSKPIGQPFVQIRSGSQRNQTNKSHPASRFACDSRTGSQWWAN